MTIDLSRQLEDRLRHLALEQGRDLSAIIEDVLRRYLDDAAITDVTPAELAATQEKLVAELNWEPWEPMDNEADLDLSHRLDPASQNKPCPLPATQPSQ